MLRHVLLAGSITMFAAACSSHVEGPAPTAPSTTRVESTGTAEAALDLEAGGESKTFDDRGFGGGRLPSAPADTEEIASCASYGSNITCEEQTECPAGTACRPVAEGSRLSCCFPK